MASPNSLGLAGISIQLQAHESKEGGMYVRMSVETLAIVVYIQRRLDQARLVNVLKWQESLCVVAQQLPLFPG